MGHIFISYSHKDTEFAHALADHLQSKGFPVWIDVRLDYGSQWPHAIQKYLDTCDAFILIMSPNAFASEWVQSELQRAKRKKKPVFPLLLEGDETWLSVESTQYYDVRNGKLPDNEFYSDLKQAISGRGTSQALSPIPASNKKTGGPPVWRLAVFGGIAVLGICLVLGILLFQQMANNLSPSPFPTEMDVLTAQSTSIGNITSSTENTMTAVISLPVELADGSEVRFFPPGGNEVRYTILSARREPASPGKQLLYLRIRVWTDLIGGINFWSGSFRLAAGDIRLAPVNDLNLIAGRDETVDGDVEFEIDASLEEAVLVISVGRISDAWATKELRLVFP